MHLSRTHVHATYEWDLSSSWVEKFATLVARCGLKMLRCMFSKLGRYRYIWGVGLDEQQQLHKRGFHVQDTETNFRSRSLFLSGVMYDAELTAGCEEISPLGFSR